MLTKNQILELCDKTILIPYLRGHAGEGKTSFVKDLAREKNLSLSILNLSCIDAADFVGMPYIKNDTTYYARPSFFDADILFLDEIDRVNDQAVKSGLLSLLVDRKINGHEFKGRIIAAGNGTQDGDLYETVEFDAALKDRIKAIDFKYSVQEKLSFLNKNFSNNTLLSYIEARTEIFSEFSTRTIYQALSISSDLDLIGVVLNQDVKRHYEQFLQSNLVTLKDLLDGESTDKLTSLAKLSLANEVANNLVTLKQSPIEKLAFINKFINDLKAEEKSVYFSKLKTLLEHGTIKKTDLTDLNELGFFKGQKEYLKELV